MKIFEAFGARRRENEQIFSKKLCVLKNLHCCEVLHYLARATGTGEFLLHLGLVM